MGLFAIEAVMCIRQYSVLLQQTQTIVPAQASFQHNRIIVHREEISQ
jgi:hypothetical protein